jgi:alcohol dehydrogenase
MAWRCPTRIIMHAGALAEALPGAVASQGRVAAVVTDRALARTPWVEAAQRALRAGDVAVPLTFDAVEANPRHTTVDKLALALKECKADVVVALGGGSVIDAAKAAAVLVRNPDLDSCVQLEGRERFTVPPLPLVACPTTCGTGSEVTWVSVVTHTEQRRKFSIKGHAMFPRIAVVDADVVLTLPESTMVYTSIDALTHAVEAMLCCRGVRNEVSDALAERAIELIMANLPLMRGSRDPQNRDRAACAALMRASTLAGMAFGSADVGAVHCLSETIGGLYDVPHGLGNAVFLPRVLRHHARREALFAPRGEAGHVAEVLKRLTHVCRDTPYGDMPGGFLAMVQRLCSDFGIPSVEELRLPAQEFSHVSAVAVMNGSNGSNPHGALTRDDYLAILSDTI